ncbi:hypothetical protein MF573_21295 [Klebsiella pneumoniae]|nr:hypothetical protein MF573_21295 [Klebsiella pneumoniae]
MEAADTGTVCGVAEKARVALTEKKKATSLSGQNFISEFRDDDDNKCASFIYSDSRLEEKSSENF